MCATISSYIAAGIRTTKPAPVTITVSPLNRPQVQLTRVSTDLRSGTSSLHQRGSRRSCRVPCLPPRAAPRAAPLHMMDRQKAICETTQALYAIALERFGSNDLNGGIIFFQAPRVARQRAACTQSGNKHIQVRQVLDDLHGRTFIVSARVRFVASSCASFTAPLLPSLPSERMIFAPYSSSTWRRSRVTLSGITAVKR